MDLVSSRTVDVPIPGKPGEVTKEIIWSGLLYKSDGKTVDSIYEWDKSGAFKNQRGVSHPNDLALFMRPLQDAELKAARAKLPAYAKPAAESEPATATAPGPGSSAVAAISEVRAAVESDSVKDPRVASKLAELTWNAYHSMIAEAVSMGILPENVQVSTIRGNWAELIASTVVDYLDHPETTPAETKPAETPKPSELPGENQ
ncbi:MAG: hypothetical protein IVW54_16660 [Candidatus Binataceae bacterium]|nr:hypothetical protein [Candidatus Binataceae bacterium]